MSGKNVKGSHEGRKNTVDPKNVINVDLATVNPLFKMKFFSCFCIKNFYANIYKNRSKKMFCREKNNITFAEKGKSCTTSSLLTPPGQECSKGIRL